MKLTPKIAGLTIAVLGLGGVATGTAFASVHAPKPAPATFGAQQQGNHTNPPAGQNDKETADDKTGAKAGQNDKETADDKTGAKAGQNDKETADDSAGDKADQNGNEKESAKDSDGPGGHADRAGNVQHRAAGRE